MTHPESQQDRERLLDAFPPPDPAAWRAEVERLLKGAPFDRAMLTRTLEGITVGPMATATDAVDLPWTEQRPGQAPYLRGASAAGHVGTPWLSAQETKLPTVEELNEVLRHDLERGQSAVYLVLDGAACMGLDPDQAPSALVGRRGTSIASLAELAVALDGVDLASTPLFIRAGTAALPVATLVAALVRQRGQSPEILEGCIGCDPVFGLAALGEFNLSVKRHYDELAVLTRWAVRSAPRLNTLPIHEHPWHDGGADDAFSLGLVLATVVTALREMEERGVALEVAAARVHFQMCAGSDFFMTIAKFRALRLLWSDIQTAAGLEPRPATIHARTSRRTRTVHDPYVNLLRATTQAMSCVLGGVQSLHVGPFDEVDSVSDAFGRRLARNIPLLLANESRLDRVIDPAGGSWYLEKLTADLARNAWQHFQEIEKSGGVVAMLRSGVIQQQVAACAEERRLRLATRREVVVGTNRYADPAEPVRKTREVDHRALQTARARQVEDQRNAGMAHADVLEQLTRVLESDDADLFAHMEAAAVHGATLGELVSILRHDDKPDLPITAIPLRRDAAPFEELRGRIEQARRQDPAGGRVHCACLGNVARYMPRLDFTREFFRVGGCEVVDAGFHDDVTGAVGAATASDARTVVIVGQDETYSALAEDLARTLKAFERPPRVILAGKPGDLADALTAAGVDEFIHARSDVLEVLGRLARRLEVEA